MRLLFAPFSIIASRISARIGRSVFRSLWAKIDDAPPPSPKSGVGSTGKVVAGQALEAGVMAGVAAAVDRAFARFFHHLIGIWPGKPPKPKDAD
jgi:hypothetical protein